MLTRQQEKDIKALHRSKGRKQSGLCLVEGPKVIEAIKDHVVFTFGPDDTDRFNDLMTTKTPQSVAAVVTSPSFTQEEVLASNTVLILDGVQDPGNVGAIFRLAQGFDATMLLIESADPTSPKVIRSAVGSIFEVPWVNIDRKQAGGLIASLDHQVFRLEKRENSESIETVKDPDKLALIIGSEGQGVQLTVEAPSVAIDHNEALESLNVGHATAIALYSRYKK